MGIGLKLQALLDAANVRPATMASDLGISKNTIYGIIKRDNKKVDIDTLIEIANYLDVPLDYFLHDSPDDARPLSAEATRLAHRYDSFDARGKKLMLALADAIESSMPIQPAQTSDDYPSDDQPYDDDEILVRAAHRATRSIDQLNDPDSL